MINYRKRVGMHILYSINYASDLVCYSFTKMLLHVTRVFVIINLITIKTHSAIWDKEITCPTSCTCRLEHLTETALYRFIRKQDNTPIPGEITSVENNEVMYEENFDSDLLLEDNTVVRTTTCIVDSETEPTKLLEQLPKNIEIITLIQGYESENKTIKFSYFDQFQHLISLEIIGSKQTAAHFICEIDVPLQELKYLNLERVLIKNSKKQIQKFIKKLNAEELTFEYVIQKHDDRNTHPLTIIQKGTNEEILPYGKFKQQENNEEVPLFIGFKELVLLRITTCELKNVHWEMFDGLQNLQYLILERNNLRFIPAFAFYGTPSLKMLSLAHNNLLDIQITDLAGLLELEHLDLSYNNFSQLSELSLPPFPKLKLGNFANNPIGTIFPNTFEVMNTTDSLIIGSDAMPLTLITNSFFGLNLLKKLTLNNLNQPRLKRDLFTGMPSLQELVLTGNITEIEYDAFLEVNVITTLVLSNCKIVNISMDAFIGLETLQYLDLSKNNLDYLPPGLFDQLTHVKEIYLNGNRFQQLPKDIFSKIHPKLLRLNENPWKCSCDMSEWKPMIVNKIKQKILKPCDMMHDKGLACAMEHRFMFKYVYENKIAPKCTEPKQFENWSVFHAMRRILKCPNYKPKYKKHYYLKKKMPLDNNFNKTDFTNKSNNIQKLEKLTNKLDLDNSILLNQEEDLQVNNLQPLVNFESKVMQMKNKFKMYKKNNNNNLNNNII